MFIEVKEFGAKVGISGGKLVVTKEGAELGRFPIGLVEAAAVHTSVQISSQAVAALSRQGVRIMWVNMSDEIICCTSADSPRFSARRKGLYRMSESPSVCIDISGRIIRTKINSQVDTLLSMGICSTDETSHLRALSDKAIICGNKLALLGIEPLDHCPCREEQLGKETNCENQPGWKVQVHCLKLGAVLGNFVSDVSRPHPAVGKAIRKRAP